ncbi:calmodulin-binding protein [Artemisia annua]|uniref:Calmodulin-binding protein n=1 Tax=Artemisia annua TaxID=35608 RepID=A0A2U1MFX7_ARTAN|nr:calmodulin-binding protein [Artemisia annua]
MLCNLSVGTLLYTEIHKVFLHMNRTRKTSSGTRKISPGTYKMESSGPKVPSRYLTGATGSCHDNCKSAAKQTTETKPINPSPKGVPKPPADRTQVDAANLEHRIKKSPSIIPKVTTQDVKKNNVPRDQFIKKDVAIEPKKRDLKLKSVNSSAKTYNPPSSRTTRRHSDIFLPSKDMPMPSTKFPKRRLSEIIPNKDVASVSNVPLVQSSRISKNESRKDSPKLPLLNKRSNSLKTTVSTPKTGPKLPPLRTVKSLPKPELKESRKSKPVKVTEEVAPENTLHVIVSGNGVEATKSQSHSSLASSSSEEKTFADGQIGLQISASSMVDDIPNHIDQDDEQIGPQASPSMEDDTAAKDGQNIEQTRLQVSSPSMEDNTSTNNDQDNEQIGLQESSPSLDDDNPTKSDQDNEQIGLHLCIPSMEDYTPVKDGQHNEQTGLQLSSPILKDNTPTEDGQKDENLEDLEVSDTKEETQSGKLKVETEDDSPDDIRFRRGTILSPQSGDSSPRKLEFRTGKELDENEAENAEHTNLRRLSSEGLVCSPESNVISVDLKHQEMEEKKDPGLSNNIIEETASKLIRARKSKVKALVGAFENIVSGNIR